MNANPLTSSIIAAGKAGSIQHEIVKKDIDCIIAEVDRDGMYVCESVSGCECECALCVCMSVSV